MLAGAGTGEAVLAPAGFDGAVAAVAEEAACGADLLIIHQPAAPVKATVINPSANQSVERRANACAPLEALRVRLAAIGAAVATLVEAGIGGFDRAKVGGSDCESDGG